MDQTQYAWRPLDWANSVGLCRATVYKLMAAGRIKSVKNNTGKNAARFITTSPQEFLANLGQTDAL